MHITFNLAGEVVRTAATEAMPVSSREVVAGYVRDLDAYLDAVAQRGGFDTRLTAALRAGYPGPFQRQGAAFASWMDQCYALGERLLAEAVAADPPLPAEAFLARLPAPPEGFR
jgi:hypothetical protein